MVTKYIEAFFLPPGIGTVKQSDFGARIKEHSMTQG